MCCQRERERAETDFWLGERLNVMQTAHGHANTKTERMENLSNFKTVDELN